ncbi:MAG: RNA polymerase factor sigma-54 [Betaproteobacteria bacterium]|nr:RNA polymerase factor sigma-54 [Betaproteobacteria bacterium]
MKHSLQLRLSQHLTLTPQLQQSIRLLQLSTLELNQELERFLQDNPLLERDEEVVDGVTSTRIESESYAEADSAPSTPEPEEPRVEAATSELGVTSLASFEDEGYGSGTRDDDDDSDFPQIPSATPTLREHLLSQTGFTQMSERDRILVSLLIDALDDSGFIAQPLEEIAQMLPPELGVELEELSIALRHLQNLDPPGVGARNLAECLDLQLKALPECTPYRSEALETVRRHLELLAARDYLKLKKALRCDDAALRIVQRLITNLNPRPGSAFAGDEARYIVPDVVVRKIKGIWLAALNPDAMPKLRINRMYSQILQRNRDASAQHLASQLQEAKWLIKNVQQRFDTILRVSQAIIDRQRHFFEHGEVAMRPLVLREIAQILDLHESTVSRVTTQKFMLTPRGIFELKYFFGSHVATETGGSCSATAIRALIKQLVSAENGKKPLSDSQLSEILGQQGIVVARRTVAKYRETLQILPVNLRKSI